MNQLVVSSDGEYNNIVCIDSSHNNNGTYESDFAMTEVKWLQEHVSLDHRLLDPLANADEARDILEDGRERPATTFPRRALLQGGATNHPDSAMHEMKEEDPTRAFVAPNREAVHEVVPVI
jgi:hypothetical protein